jgi:hypothetical protein
VIPVFHLAISTHYLKHYSLDVLTGSESIILRVKACGLVSRDDLVLLIKECAREGYPGPNKEFENIWSEAFPSTDRFSEDDKQG